MNSDDPVTQKGRRAILERFREQHGDKRFHKLSPQHVAKLLVALKPYAQRNMLKALRGLTAFAFADGLINNDQTSGVRLVRVKDRGGFRTWEPEHVEAFRACYALGTRARLALELLYGSMQRRGDAVRIGRQHIRGGILSIRQSKTGAQIDVPVLPELQEAIDAMPRGDNLNLLVTESGKPATATAFGIWFRRQCDRAGLPSGLSAHGLRKASAARFAEHGATAAELMAWGGWKTLSQVQRYIEAANRKRLAAQTADKIRSETKVANLGVRLANEGEKL